MKVVESEKKKKGKKRKEKKRKRGDLIARQKRYEPPPEFPLASPCSGIDHHLSGPNVYALTQISRKR